jgi:hypothetical protein
MDVMESERVNSGEQSRRRLGCGGLAATVFYIPFSQTFVIANISGVTSTRRLRRGYGVHQQEVCPPNTQKARKPYHADPASLVCFVCFVGSISHEPSALSASSAVEFSVTILLCEVESSKRLGHEFASEFSGVWRAGD